MEDAADAKSSGISPFAFSFGVDRSLRKRSVSSVARMKRARNPDKFAFQNWSPQFVIRRRLLILIFCICPGACTSEQATRGVYEGIQNRNEALKTPAEKAVTPPAPSYPDYEAQRKAKQNSQ